MNYLSEKEVKTIEVEVLSKIDKICRANKIQYSLAYGTLLGAIRHKGFIPWDDDIDIAMPREDYEKFLDYCDTHQTPFYIITYRKDRTWPYLYIRCCDPHTLCEKDPFSRRSEGYGLFVDIVPIDGMGDSLRGARLRMAKTMFHQYLAVAADWKKYFRSRTQFTWKVELARIPFYIMSRFTNCRRAIGKVEKYNMRMNLAASRYGAIACGGGYKMKEIMESKWFTEFIDVEFEGRQFRAFKHYDEILTHIYGDYMTPPPKEQQVGHHYIKAYRKNNV